MSESSGLGVGLELQRLYQRQREASSFRDFAMLIQDLEMLLPVIGTAPDLPLFSVLPSTFESPEVWPELLSQYQFKDNVLGRLLCAGFSPLDRKNVVFDAVGDPFPSSINSRYLLVDQDYGTVLLPPEDDLWPNYPLANQALRRYNSYYPILKRYPSAIFSLGAIRGHLGYYGALNGNYFEPIELTVSSRSELDELVARLREHLSDEPTFELWFRGQPTEYSSEDLKDLAEIGICPWRSFRDPSLVPSLCRRLVARWNRWREYAAILVELAHVSIFFAEHLNIPTYQVSRLRDPSPTSLGAEFYGIVPELVGEWSDQGKAHHYDTTFRNLQRMFFFQHYGLPSTVLDITHDLDVALFFANHRIENNRYVKVEPDPSRTLYIFVLQKGLDHFLDSRQISERYGLLRPTRQQCGLIAGASMINRNACARFVSVRVHLKADIQHAELYPGYLFPAPDEDTFLQALLSFQRKHKISQAKAFVLSEH